MTYTWDSDNKLRSADIDANGTADVNFQYDALGRRVARTGTGGSVVFVQMDQQTIADYPVGGAATTPTFRYVYASYIDEPVVRKGPTSTSTAHFYHRNQQYSVTAITTSTGAISERYAYTAYGQPTILNASGSVISATTLSNRYTYTGREWDATLGLHHFRARWLSPLLGRFANRDPIGLGAGLNFYANTFDIRLTDPSGLKSCTTKKYGVDFNNVHAPHGSAVREFTRQFFGKVLPCEIDVRGSGYVKTKTCSKCCNEATGAGEDGELEFSGTGNGLLKCHSEGFAWVEFGGKLGIEVSLKREWDTCVPFDHNKMCVKVTGGLFGCGCVGFRLLGTRACACLKLDCAGGICLKGKIADPDSMGPACSGSCKLSITGDACVFGFCAVGEGASGEYDFCKGSWSGSVAGVGSWPSSTYH